MKNKSDLLTENLSLMQLLPGLYYMRKHIQEQIDTIELALGVRLVSKSSPRTYSKESSENEKALKRKEQKRIWAKAYYERKKAGEKAEKYIKSPSAGVKSYWANMTPEQRKIEVDKRTKKRIKTMKEKAA